MATSSSPMLRARALVLVVAFLAVVHGGSNAGVSTTPLDDLCRSLGGFYVTPELCVSSLCVDPLSCRSARDAPELASLAARLAAANATAVKASLEAALSLAGEAVLAPSSAADAEDKKGMQSCLQLYARAVPALEWAARSVAAGRYSGAREVLEAAQNIPSGCAGMAGKAALPKENDRFFTMANVAHAVVAYVAYVDHQINGRPPN